MAVSDQPPGPTAARPARREPRRRRTAPGPGRRPRPAARRRGFRRSRTPSRNSPDRLACKVFRSAAPPGIHADRGDHQVVQLRSQSPGSPVEHVVLSTLPSSGRSDRRYPSSSRTRSPVPTIRVARPAGLFANAEIGCEPEQFGRCRRAGWAPSRTDSTTERAVIRDSESSLIPRRFCGRGRRTVRRGAARLAGTRVRGRRRRRRVLPVCRAIPSNTVLTIRLVATPCW